MITPQEIRAALEAATPYKWCGYQLTNPGNGEAYPCDDPATGWRWYQDVEHEDMLDPACIVHANEGGRRMAQYLGWLAELLAENERLSDLASDRRSEVVRLEQIAREWEANEAEADARAEAAEQAVERVRALHHHDLFRGHLDNGCKICGHGPDDSGYPCPTIRALDGDS